MCFCYLIPASNVSISRGSAVEEKKGKGTYTKMERDRETHTEKKSEIIREEERREEKEGERPTGTSTMLRNFV